MPLANLVLLPIEEQGRLEINLVQRNTWANNQKARNQFCTQAWLDTWKLPMRGTW